MLCYPEICSMTSICDLTNEIDILACQIGVAYHETRCEKTRESLKILLETSYSIMKSLRSDSRLSGEFEEQLKEISLYFSNKIKKQPYNIFNLPIGSKEISLLHLCRAMSKKISRECQKLSDSSQIKDESICNTLRLYSNIFYYMAISAMQNEKQ